MHPVGLFALLDRLRRLSKLEDPLEVLDQVAGFKQFWEPLKRALARRTVQGTAIRGMNR